MQIEFDTHPKYWDSLNELLALTNEKYHDNLTIDEFISMLIRKHINDDLADFKRHNKIK